MTVDQCMNKEVIAVSSEATLTEALKLMFKHNIGALPVVDKKCALVGIVSKSDAATVKKELRESRMVHEAMTAGVHCADAGDLIKDALHCMTQHQVNRLPVIKKGKLVGILTRDDVIKYFVESKNQEMGR